MRVKKYLAIILSLLTIFSTFGYVRGEEVSKPEVVFNTQDTDSGENIYEYDFGKSVNVNVGVKGELSDESAVFLTLDFPKLTTSGNVIDEPIFSTITNGIQNITETDTAYVVTYQFENKEALQNSNISFQFTLNKVDISMDTVSVKASLKNESNDVLAETSQIFTFKEAETTEISNEENQQNVDEQNSDEQNSETTTVTEASTTESSETTTTTSSRRVRRATSDATEDVLMDILTRDKDSSGNNVYSYLTGKDIRAQADVLVSGTGVNYPSGKLVISVPKQTANGIQINKPTFISSKEAVSSVEGETDDAYTMTYTFSAIKGGLIGTYDFIFKFLNEVTVNGDTITPTWTMTDKDGNVLRQVSKEFTAIARSNWNSKKWIPDDWNEVTIDDQNYSGNADGTGYQELRKTLVDQKAPSATPSTGSGYRVRYIIDSYFDPQGDITDTTLGIYNAQTVTFVDTIPEEGTFEEMWLDGGSA